MRHHFLTADVFTDRPFGGNPLAVFPRAGKIPEDVMQKIAREFNLSETVFVLPSSDPACSRRLRIFTPGSELAFAGHPTVGTAFVLASMGEIDATPAEQTVVFEEGVGAVPVLIRSAGGRPVFTQLSVAVLPQRGPDPPPASEIAAAVSLSPEELMAERATPEPTPAMVRSEASWRRGVGWAPEAYSCGAPFLFVPLRNREALERAEVDPARWRSVLASYWAPQVFLFCLDPERQESDLRARMFAPGLGITEDPATGSAAAALAGYLVRRTAATQGPLHWVIEQGFEMGRPSIIELDADLKDGATTSVRVGGTSVLVSEGTIEA